jgi:GDPmannose 4,6-dehydratase
MLQQNEADDYVIATGVTRSLEAFVEAAFAEVGLDWHQHVVIDPALERPADIGTSRGSAAKAERVLGWKATVPFPEIVRRLVAAERQALARSA